MTRGAIPVFKAFAALVFVLNTVLVTTGCSGPKAASEVGSFVSDNFEYKMTAIATPTELAPAMFAPEGTAYIVVSYKVRTTDGQTTLSPLEPPRLKCAEDKPIEADVHASSRTMTPFLAPKFKVSGMPYGLRQELLPGTWYDFNATYLVPQAMAAQTAEMSIVP